MVNWRIQSLVLLAVLLMPALVLADDPFDTDENAKPVQKQSATETEKADNDEAATDEVEDKAVEDKPAEDKPAEDKPAEDETAQDEAAKNKPAEDQSAKVEANGESARNQSSGDQGQADSGEKAKGAHLLPLRGSYVDYPEPLGVSAMSLLTGSVVKQKSFHRLSEHLEKLGKDNGTDMVVLDLSDPSLEMNVALLNEFARRMTTLKRAGKRTVAWLEDASNVQLVMAAQCDEVVMAEFGGIDMPSLAVQSMYFRDAMDMLGIKASVIRAGDYKGAVEPYTEPEMSAHLRQHYVEMLRTINDSFVQLIAKGRGMSIDDVRKLQGRRFLTAKAAVEAGLVDRLAPYGSVRHTVDQMAGSPMKWTSPAQQAKKELSFFELMGMLMAGPTKPSSTLRDTSIAVLHLSGAIIDGKQESSGSIVDGPTVREIKQLAEDDKVKAVVVRINSPGGSATASESIRQALKQLAEKKPTVVSMGDVAASGGYWISCIGVPVYAEPGTITGSIGVFSMKLSLGTLLRRVGVRMETISLDDSAAAFSLDRTWNGQEQEALGAIVDDVYDRFLNLVAQSRSMKVDQVKPLAGGRVWSGSQAKEHGLVDELGGLDVCLRVVAEKAQVSDYKVVHRPVAKTGLDILDLLGEGDEQEIRQLVPASLLKTLEAQGFDLTATRVMLREALHGPSGRPKVWALQPMELHIR